MENFIFELRTGSFRVRDNHRAANLIAASRERAIPHGSSAVDLAGNFLFRGETRRERAREVGAIGGKSRGNIGREKRETRGDEGRGAEDPRVRVMCIGRDARINNSRVISRIIIRYIGPYRPRSREARSRVRGECVTVLNTVTSGSVHVVGGSIRVRRRRRYR